MAPFKSSIMMICIIMNIVHAGFNEDVQMCISQLQSAFTFNYESASQCLRHAIKYYVKGQRIPVPEEFLLDENRNIASDRQIDSKMNANLEDNFTKWLAEELKKDTISVFGDDYDRQQVVEGSSENDFSSSEIDFSSSEQDSSSSEIDFSSYFGFNSKEDFNYWLESFNWIKNEGQQNIEAQQDYALTQHDYPLNYAELYHRQLENMITGKHVLNRRKFCDKFFRVVRHACHNVLKPFGDYSISAVRVAFNLYTLDVCERLKSSDPNYIFIYSYMVSISKVSKAGQSTKPSTYCQQKIMAKYDLKELPKI